MTVTQTVDIPASRRLTIEVPREIPAGRTIIAFTPVPAKKDDTTGYNARDLELINLNAEQLNEEALDVLSYQNGYPEGTSDI